MVGTLALFSSVHFSSVTQSCLILCNPMDARQASLSITNSQDLLKLMSIMLVMPSNHLVPCCPLLLSPSIFPSIRVFSNESVLRLMWPKYWSFSFSISPSDEHSGLISLGWTGQLSHPYTTTGKTIALTTQTFVCKVMSLLFNMLSQFSSVQSLSHVQLFVTP